MHYTIYCRALFSLLVLPHKFYLQDHFCPSAMFFPYLSSYRPIYQKQQKDGIELDQMQGREDGICCSCWRAIFHVTQNDETRLDGKRDTREELDFYETTSQNDDELGCCPWRQVLNIGGNQRPQRRTHTADASAHRTSNADGQSDSHTYSEVEQTRSTVCCPWVRNLRVSEDERNAAKKAAPNNVMPRDKPAKGCCGWAAIFWVNKEEMHTDDEHVTTEITSV